jgi:hypothetical protein
MKKIATVFGTLVFVASGTMAPAMAFPKSQTVDSESQQEQLLIPEESVPSSNPSVSSSRKMAIYGDCIQAHGNMGGADFKQVNKFCSCVTDQTIQGTEGTFSSCAEGGGKGSMMGVLGEVGPSVITGVMQGMSSRNSNKNGGFLNGGGGLLNGLGGLLGGGSGGGGLLGGGSDGGFNIKDILKGRL